MDADVETFDFGRPAARGAWARCLSHLPEGEAGEEEFTTMARALFAWQFEHCEPYRRLAEARGVTPARLADWRDIPAVPQRLFKEMRLFSHEGRAPGRVFHTSGTTTGTPGKQHLLDDRIYRQTALTGAQAAGLWDEDHPVPELQILAPPPREAAHSSLSAMFEYWCEAALEAERRESAFWVRGERLMLHGLRERLEVLAAEGRPVGVCGAAFSLVHYLDAYSTLDPVPLPPGSWLLETGGFKGRSRELPKDEFYQALRYLFDLPEDALWNEYGMTELSSQAYARGVHGRHTAPPWARVLVIDPETEREVEPGQPGLVRWIDLANVDSVLALQTLDQAVRHEEGFSLMGRLPQADPRGCSLAADDYKPETR
ncbi:MAG: acyl-protein synthetase [Verrucomicrobiota bacterium]